MLFPLEPGKVTIEHCIPMHDNAKELLPVVDADGRVVGQATRGECHNGAMLLHPVVHLHVFNPEGELFLQRRPAWKDIQPDKWDTAVGGHVDWGETVADALRREAREELGLTDFIPRPSAPYVFTSDRERELVNPFTTITAGPLHPTEELAGGRFWRREEIVECLGKGVFTPQFEQEYRRLFMVSA